MCSYAPKLARALDDGLNRVRNGWMAATAWWLKKVVRRNIRLAMNLWPPFLGAGIRVKRLSADWKAIDVEMKLRRWNTNYVGTHYGGSLYSMTDPFFMLMLIENLGRDYIVWDKASSIRFRKPGRGTVSARFRLSEQELQDIRDVLKGQEKVDRSFAVQVTDESGTVIAEVHKQVQVRRSPHPASIGERSHGIQNDRGQQAPPLSPPAPPSATSR